MKIPFFKLSFIFFRVVSIRDDALNVSFARGPNEDTAEGKSNCGYFLKIRIGSYCLKKGSLQLVKHFENNLSFITSRMNEEAN